MNDSSPALLRLRDWSLIRETASGPITLLSHIDLSLFRGELVGLLGANGSGKTSLLHYLAAEESPLALPVGLVFQDPDAQIVAATVTEELTFGRPDVVVAELLALYGLTGLDQLDPRLLSAGEKQRLTVAVALAGNPEILLCDEPTTLQDAEQAAWLLDFLVDWPRRSGGTILLATQREHEARLCDRVVVLEQGHIVAEGEPASVLARPEVAAVLGWDDPNATATPASDATDGRPATDENPGAVVAEWRDVTYHFAATGRGFRGVNRKIQPGERLGITGANGCGKSTLLYLTAGLLSPSAGRCYLGDKPLCEKGPHDLDHNLALLAPQFPEYLFTRTTVADEISLDPVLAAGGVTPLLTGAGLPERFASRNPHALSSGERRRLALSLVILSGRPLILLDEPTAGLDGRGRRRFQQLLSRLPRWTALVIASHDRQFLRACGCTLLELGPAGLRDVAAE
ncbi:MAG: ATP-binding cassette domain-containing protein [bacterium]